LPGFPQRTNWAVPNFEPAVPVLSQDFRHLLTDFCHVCAPPFEERATRADLRGISFWHADCAKLRINKNTNGAKEIKNEDS